MMSHRRPIGLAYARVHGSISRDISRAPQRVPADAHPSDLAKRGIPTTRSESRCEGELRIETAQMLVKLLTIWIAPGPTMTTNRAGRTHRISGKTIFTGVCAAFASIA